MTCTGEERCIDGCWTNCEVQHLVVCDGEVVKETVVPLWADPNPDHWTPDGEQSKRLRFTYPNYFGAIVGKKNAKMHRVCAWAFGPGRRPRGCGTYEGFESTQGVEADHLGDSKGVCRPEHCFAGWVELVSAKVNLARKLERQAVRAAERAKAAVQRAKVAARELQALRPRQHTARKRALTELTESSREAREFAKTLLAPSDPKLRSHGHAVTTTFDVNPQNPLVSAGWSTFEAEEYSVYCEQPLAVVLDACDSEQPADQRTVLKALCAHWDKAQAQHSAKRRRKR